MSNEMIPPGPMMPAQYIETQMRLLEMGKIADSLDLECFLLCIRNAENVAPLIDPTLWKQASAKMLAIKRLAKIAIQLRNAYGETYKAAFEPPIKETNAIVVVNGKDNGQT